MYTWCIHYCRNLNLMYTHRNNYYLKIYSRKYQCYFDLLNTQPMIEHLCQQTLYCTVILVCKNFRPTNQKSHVIQTNENYCQLFPIHCPMEWPKNNSMHFDTAVKVLLRSYCAKNILAIKWHAQWTRGKWANRMTLKRW